MNPCTARTPSTRPPRKSRPGKSPRTIQKTIPQTPTATVRSPQIDADEHAGPLDRLGPEAREHVQREPDEAERRVARAVGARLVREVDLDDARAGREDERLRELLLADLTPRTGSSAEREYALKAQPKSETSTPVKPPQHPVDRASRAASAPSESSRPTRRPLATSAPPSTASIRRGRSSGDVLEVGVHRDDDVAAGPDEAGVHRRVLAEVPLEADGPQARSRRRRAARRPPTCRPGSRRRRRSSRTAAPAPRGSRWRVGTTSSSVSSSLKTGTTRLTAGSGAAVRCGAASAALSGSAIAPQATTSAARAARWG